MNKTLSELREKMSKISVTDLLSYDSLNAREYANNAHSIENQLYDGKPYVEGHLDNVVRFFLAFFKADPVMIACLYNHDVLEDTKEGRKTLCNVFGAIVFNIVYNVTDGEGASREERQQKTYIRTRNDFNALCVKLCDRGFNMLASKGTRHARVYVEEYPRFKGALYTGCDAYEHVWEVLDLIYKELKDDLDTQK